MIKQDKSNFIEKMAAEFKAAKSTVFVNYTGMGVKAQQELKKALKDAGGRMLVGKNTLLRLAGQEAKLPEEALTDSILSGQTAVIIADSDPVSPIQALGKFLKTSDFPQMKVAVVEGQFHDQDGLVALSKLPSKEVLVGQALGTIASPLYGFVSTLESKMRELVYILDTKSKG